MVALLWFWLVIVVDGGDSVVVMVLSDYSSLLLWKK